MTLLQWGIVAAMTVVVAGRILSPRVADYLVAEPMVRRRMRRNAAVGVGVVVALAVLTMAAIWLMLASITGCAWIGGVGGCLPGLEAH